jgi:hypothetical protein
MFDNIQILLEGLTLYNILIHQDRSEVHRDCVTTSRFGRLQRRHLRNPLHGFKESSRLVITIP